MEAGEAHKFTVKFRRIHLEIGRCDDSVERVRDICYKEAIASYVVLLSAIDQLWDRRVKVQIDSLGLYHAWTGLKAKSLALAQVLKLIFALTLGKLCATVRMGSVTCKHGRYSIQGNLVC